MIERNTTIPTKRSETFTTAENNQPQVEIHVLQGEREMAEGNKSLGKFTLTDIPPAPQGIPQIEVTFDIDANGIVKVSAKDLGTGKEQEITITGGTALSDDEIDKMVKDAEEHANDDAKKRELVETRNMAEALVSSTEKMIDEHKDKASDDEIKSIEEAIQELKKELENDNNTVDSLKSIIEKLSEAGQSLATKIYEETSKESNQQSDESPEGDVVDGEVVEDE